MSPTGGSSRFDLDDLLTGIEGRDRAVIGRALTLVESRRPDHQRLAATLVDRLLPRTGGALRVGISGVPGGGKSTLVERLGLRLVERGHRVAVAAVDPSSAVSGGSVLGDKTRMTELSRRPEAFIRPSPAAGTLGGVARRTRETTVVLEAAGFDVVLVETVGVGQSEAAVADMVDTFVLVVLAGAGDDLQGIKRGVLELVDVVAINKADGPNRPRVERARAQLAAALAILRGPTDAPPVIATSGRDGTGIDELWEAVRRHREALAASGELDRRRRRQRSRWMRSLVEDELFEAFRRHPEVRRRWGDLEASVVAGARAPGEAARLLLEAFGLDRLDLD